MRNKNWIKFGVGFWQASKVNSKSFEVSAWVPQLNMVQTQMLARNVPRVWRNAM